MILGLGWLALFAWYLHGVPGAPLPDDSPLTVACVWGLEPQHPPGYPLFTLVARLAAALPVGGPAFRLNVFAAAVFAAVAAIAGALTAGLARKAGAGRVAAALGGLAAAGSLALGRTAWFEAESAKGAMYGLNLLLTLGLLAEALRRPVRPGAAARAGWWTGLGLAHHWMSFVTAGPAVAIALAGFRPKLPSARSFWVGAGFVALGLSPYLLLPMRARAAAVGWGTAPTAGAFVEVVGRRQQREGFAASGVVRRDFGKAAWMAGVAWREWTPAGLAAGLAGAAAAAAGSAAAVAALGALAAADAAAVFWSAHADPAVYRVLDHFLLPALAALAIAFGMGLARWSAGRAPAVAPVAVAVALAVLAMARAPSRDFSRLALSADFGADVLAGLPAGAVLLCEGDMDWFPALYQGRVEGRRPDVVPVCASMLAAGWGPYRGGAAVARLKGRTVVGTIQWNPEGVGSAWAARNDRLPFGLTQRAPAPGVTPEASARVLRRARTRGWWAAAPEFADRATDLVQAPAMAWVRLGVWAGGNVAPPARVPLVLEAWSRALALPLTPSGEEVRLNQALLLWRLGRRAEAAGAAARAAADWPESPRARDLAARMAPAPNP